MDIFSKLLLFFWVIISVKQILFWIYLWQLKEYHIARFLDHFSTEKGKKLILNPLQDIKIILLAIAVFSSNLYFLYILLVIYFVQVISILKQIVTKVFKKPKFTKKALFLIFVSFAVYGLFLLLIERAIVILFFDILTPIIVSLIVLSFQPIVVFARNKILKEAKEIIDQRKDLLVIGITGSYGKTTTKEFLNTILSSKYNVLCTKEHKNSEMGIAQTILEDLSTQGGLVSGGKPYEIFIVEMGAYKKGGIKMLADIVRPRFGIVTGVTIQHLSLFGSLENLLSAEGGGELVEALPQNGFIALNGENKYCLDLYKKINITKKIYTEEGNKIESDIYAKEIEVSKNGLAFLAITKDKHAMHFKVNVLGRHNLQNILAAILVAKEVGMSLEEISKAVENIRPEQAGITFKKGIHNIDIIDSSYSSNPEGAVADLDCLDLFGGPAFAQGLSKAKKKIIVMPCLIELGEKSKDVHEMIGKKIAEVCDLAIITTKDRFKEIKKGAIENGIEAKNILFLENSEEIFHKITTFCKEGDSVLLEGRVPSSLIKLLTNEK
jgi:UDP-N-acetylmuramoyl-tripeptide--D-alanyl-D-alanine ligase